MRNECSIRSADCVNLFMWVQDTYIYVDDVIMLFANLIAYMYIHTLICVHISAIINEMKQLFIFHFNYNSNPPFSSSRHSELNER